MFLRVFYRNIAFDRGLDGKHQLFRAVQHRNAAVDGIILVRTLNCNSAELIVFSLQVHVFGAFYHNLWCYDTRCLFLSLGLGLDDITRFRGQRYILICRKHCTCRLCHITFSCQVSAARGGKISAVGKHTVLKEIFDRDIPCHIPIDSNGHRIGIVFDTHIPVNGRHLSGLGFEAVHDDVIELIFCVFQQQGFVAEGVDGIGGDSAFVRLGDASIEGRQSQRFFRIGQISRLHQSVQRQIVIGSKRRITTGVDRPSHRRFHNRPNTVLFLFPSHGQRAIAYCDKFSHRLDVSQNQRAILDAQRNASHTAYIGRFRRNVHRSTVIQDANWVIFLAHNTGSFVRFELQRLSGVNVRFGNILIGTAHLEALITFNGNRIFCVHGSQAENISIVHILDEHILVGPCLYQIPVQGNGQRFARGADAFCTAGEDQVIT